MIKRLLSITAILLFGMAATVAAQVKVGYMNTQDVLNQLPERDSVQTELESFIQQKQQELTERTTQYQDAVADYQSNSSSMSQQQMETRENELTEMRTSLEEFDQSIRRQINEKRQELLAPVLDRVDKAIAAIAESEGLDFVFNKSTNAGNPLIFYASQNQIDITNRVVSQLTSTSN